MNLPKTLMQERLGTLFGAVALVGLAAGYCLNWAGGGGEHWPPPK